MNNPEDKTVLVVEDEPDVRMFLAATLEDAGFQVVTASNGQEAYNRVKEVTPDVITLDLVMPRQSGVLFYRRLRKNAKWTGIPVLIVTAHARDDLGQEDFNELMKGTEIPSPEGYLEKPVNPVQLVSRVASLVGVKVDEFLSETADETRGEVMAELRGADLKTLQKVKDLLKDR